MVIEALQSLPSGHVSVSLADGTKLRCTLGAVTALRLYAGKELSAEELSELKRLSGREMLRDKALELLSRRMYSEKELQKKLTEKGAEEADALACTAWLQENGFLDDARYAAAIVRHYSAKGYGMGRIRAELSRRGIARELWEDAAEGRGEDDGALHRYIKKHLRDPNDRDAVRKLSAALCRRGFSWEEIRRALEEFHAEAEEE